MIPVMLITNDHHLPLLRGFSYLWNKYAGDDKPVTIFGFSLPPFMMPSNFTFKSLGTQLPVSEWSRGLRRAILQFGQKHFILMLEDFWFYDRVDWKIINLVAKRMDDSVLRIDLAGNRAALSPHKLTTIDTIDGYDVIEAAPETPYQMSYQAGIWHGANLLKVLRDTENPWESEVNGSHRVGDLRVIGTQPAAMHYQPVYRAKRQTWQLSKIRTVDIKELKHRRWLNGL
jgi:hypothetical protein